MMVNKLIELIKYGFWGLVSTGINLLLFYGFTYCNIPYVFANVSSYAIAVYFSYLFNNRFVFKESAGQETEKKIKYFLVRAVSILVDSTILVVLHEVCGLHIWISKIIDSFIIILGTYIVNKLWIFTRKEA